MQNIIHLLTNVRNSSLHLRGSNWTINSDKKKMKSKASNAIPILRRVVEPSFMTSYLQAIVQFKLIELRAFSKSHGLAVEISTLDDINATATTYRKCCNNSYTVREMKNKQYF